MEGEYHTVSKGRSRDRDRIWRESSEAEFYSNTKGGGRKVRTGEEE
jgi:hypothetical protein